MRAITHVSLVLSKAAHQYGTRAGWVSLRCGVSRETSILGFEVKR